MSARLRHLSALVIAVAGVALSIAAAQYQQRDNRQVLERRLQRLLDHASEGVGARIQGYRNVLRGMRGLLLVAGPDRTTPAQLSRYLANIDVEHEFPGARGFGFARRVAPAAEAAYVARQRLVHGKFALRQVAPNQDERYVIQLFESIGGNESALGLDLASEPKRRRAALDAMRSGAARLTAPITLVFPGSSAGQAFLLMLPVYDKDVIPPPPERETHLIGWTYAPLQVDTILRGLVDPNEQATLGLEDVSGGAVDVVLPPAAGDELRARAHIDVFGRRWRLTLSAGEAFVAQQGLTQPSTVLAAGLAASAALSALAMLAAAGRRRKHELRDGRARLAAIVDSSIDAIIGKDLGGRITSWNRGAENLFGYSPQEAVGRTAAELLVPADRLGEESRMLAWLADGAAVADLETRRRHKDGHLIDVWLAVSPVRDAKGAVGGLAVTMRDITGRKAAEEEVRAANARLEDTVASRTAQLRQLNALLRGVLDAATGVAIVATGADGLITVFNRGAELMLGYPAQEMVGRATPMLFHDAEEVAGRAAELSAAQGGPVAGFDTFVSVPARDGAETREWTYVRRDGGRIAVSLIVSAIKGADGAIDGYLGVAVDVTARKELLASLRQAKEQADAASDAKSTFLANMSHEIRTPLNAVLGMLQLLQMTRLDARQQDYTDKAGQAARALLQLLNDVLDYSKIEAGKLQLDPHPFELDGLMRDLGTILSGNQGGKPVELLFDMDPRLPDCVVGDRLRLQQVLINLAGNALKFTERGSVRVGIELLAQDAGAARIRVAVRDTGIGIEPRQRERIFEGFTQAEASISRRFGGTGLGLVICQRLLAQMGAELRLDSEPGAGSCFWFDLEFGLAPALPAAAPAALRVLVVDDHPEAGEALERMVRGLGWEAVLCASGVQALTLLGEPACCFDVVLLDWRMPGLDGLETAHCIRRACVQAPIVLMVTAAGREMLLEAQGNDADAPFSGVLTKPVTPRLISEAVARALVGPRPETVAPQRTQRLAGMRILVVEDNVLNRQVARELLEREGAQVAVAVDGRQGVDHLLGVATLPDAVLMDMQMPGMDGLEATRLIRRSLCASLPIIAMTANAGPGDRARCLEAGMNEHLGKPIDLEALVQVLRPGAGAAAAPPRVAAGPIGAVLARFGNDAAVYLRSLDAFFPEADGLLARVRAALAGEERTEAAAAVHSLKGAAATVGAAALAIALADVQRGLKEGCAGPELLALLEGWTPAAVRETCAALRAAAAPFLPTETSAAPGAEVDLAVLDGLLADGNLRALDLAEEIAAGAKPGSSQAMLAEQIGNCDFAGARATLARLRAAASCEQDSRTMQV
ncbi:response regulator [Massilia sp. G4R7]|uniref:histidine kinase n=1 Tax=Massilia phyllostachyos TaxID=2898585 RepID=A0ABS8QDN8_9BURK|nr:response regulator [Massilia phyllostachyos]MCD2518810.1 response regulator [Massilia phyllostachyos]